MTFRINFFIIVRWLAGYCMKKEKEHLHVQ